jgi:hypothetical protein
VEYVDVREEVANMGERRGAHTIQWGILRERENLEDLTIDGSVILTQVFTK